MSPSIVRPSHTPLHGVLWLLAVLISGERWPLGLLTAPGRVSLVPRGADIPSILYPDPETEGSSAHDGRTPSTEEGARRQATRKAGQQDHGASTACQGWRPAAGIAGGMAGVTP